MFTLCVLTLALVLVKDERATSKVHFFSHLPRTTTFREEDVLRTIQSYIFYFHQHYTKNSYYIRDKSNKTTIKLFSAPIQTLCGITALSSPLQDDKGMSVGSRTVVSKLQCTPLYSLSLLYICLLNIYYRLLIVWTFRPTWVEWPTDPVFLPCTPKQSFLQVTIIKKLKKNNIKTNKVFPSLCVPAFTFLA